MHVQASASEVLKAVRVRLTAQDLDQEVKECAVSCAAALVAQLGDALQADYTSLMQARPHCARLLWPGGQTDALPPALALMKQQSLALLPQSAMHTPQEVSLAHLQNHRGEGAPWHDGKSACVQGLLDKLQSDTTRLAAVKAFGRIAESPLPLDMAPVLDRLLSELTSYLRKSNRLLRQAALATIEVCSPSAQHAHSAGLHILPSKLHIRFTASFLQMIATKAEAAPVRHCCFVCREQDASSSFFPKKRMAARLNAGCIVAHRL